MPRENIHDLLGFVAVARERSFTRASGQLNLSPSALSHSIRGLEERLGVRLFARTTRSVSLTDAGERLLQTIGPALEEIDVGLAAVSALRDKPSGMVRITAGDNVIETILWPKLSRLLRDYPDIRIELSSDNGLTDIIAERFDAGVRLGERLARDMIAVPISPDMRMMPFAAPGYVEARGMPKTPQELSDHDCVNLRMPTRGGLYAWEFEQAGRAVNIRVDGQFVFNSIALLLRAALDGFGFAYLPEDMALPYEKKGRLVRALDDWCPPFPGYHLYYPSRRQPSPAFSLVVEALRYRGG